MKTATKQAQRTPDWKATLRANVRKLNAAQAQAWLDRYNAENPDKGGTIFHASVREMTGGYNSQSINWIVVRAVAARRAALAKVQS